MKFLCVPCDRPMDLSEAAPPERGSVRLVYSCPDCGYEFAMLTNPHETQMVGSLGVRLGSAENAEGAPAAASGSKCPFTGMVRDMTETATGFPWTREAELRLSKVPEFVRPMVRSGIEKFARERGHREVSEQVLDEASGSLGVRA